MIGDPADAMIADAVAYKVPGIPIAEALAAMVHGATAPQTGKPDRRLAVLIMLGLFLLVAPLPLVRWGRQRHRGRRTNAIAVAYLLLLLSIVEVGVSAIPKAPAAGNSGPVERPGLSLYLRYGYVPYDHGSDPVWGPASTSEEYYIDDFAVSRVAAAAGRADLAATFSARAGKWRLVVNPANGYVEPRNKNGTFVRFSNSGDAADGYAEGDETVYQWLVPFDLGGLIQAIGGDKVASQRLAAVFSQPDNSGGLEMANEPGFAMPWTYLWLDEPGKAAATIRRFQETFADTPAGLPGDDDLGATSSWYVWSALGLYPLIPGVPGYAVTPASFPAVTIRAPKPWVVKGRASVQPWVNASTRAGGPLPSLG